MKSSKNWFSPIIFRCIEVSGNHPPVRNVFPVQTALVEEDGVKVLVFLQVPIGRRKASSLRTASCVEIIQMLTNTFEEKKVQTFVERLSTKTQVILLASVGLVPKEDVPFESLSCKKKPSQMDLAPWCYKWMDWYGNTQVGEVPNGPNSKSFRL